MKFSIKLLTLICVGFVHEALGASDAIKEFTLDEHTVYTVAVSLDRVTTISFPGPITAIDAAQVTADNKSPASFQIAHSPGTSFLSIRALAHKAASNLNLRWNGKTYVLELVESPTPLYSVIFTPPPEPIDRIEPVSVSPHRLLALLDKAKDYPLLKAYHPESVMQVEYRNYAKQPRVMDYHDYEIQLDEVFRFDSEDTLVFHIRLRNKTDQPLAYAKGNKHSAELPLLFRLRSLFQRGDLLLADRGFCSYVVMALLEMLGVACLFRLHHARPADLREGIRLAAAIGLEPGDEVQWELLDRTELHLLRVKTTPTAAKAKARKS